MNYLKLKLKNEKKLIFGTVTIENETYNVDEIYDELIHLLSLWMKSSFEVKEYEEVEKVVGYIELYERRFKYLKKLNQEDVRKLLLEAKKVMSLIYGDKTLTSMYYSFFINFGMAAKKKYEYLLNNKEKIIESYAMGMSKKKAEEYYERRLAFLSIENQKRLVRGYAALQYRNLD